MLQMTVMALRGTWHVARGTLLRIAHGSAPCAVHIVSHSATERTLPSSYKFGFSRSGKTDKYLTFGGSCTHAACAARFF